MITVINKSEQILWEQGVKGSNPFAPTSDLPTGEGFSSAFLFWDGHPKLAPASPDNTKNHFLPTKLYTQLCIRFM